MEKIKWKKERAGKQHAADGGGAVAGMSPPGSQADDTAAQAGDRSGAKGPSSALSMAKRGTKRGTRVRASRYGIR